MAFCKYCGQPVADQAAFCGACGKQLATPAQPVAAPAQPVAAPAPKKPNWILLGGIAAAVVAVIVVVVLLLGGGSSPEAAFENMWDVTYGRDVSGVRDLAPDSCWTYIAQRYGVNDQLVGIAIQQEFTEDMGSLMGATFDYKILSTVDCDDAQLNELRAEVAEEVECIAPMSITDARVLMVQITMNGMPRAEEMVAIEVDGDWYLLDGIDMVVDAIEEMSW